MSGRTRWLAGALVVVALAGAGCSEGDEGDESSGDPAATLEEVEGEEVAPRHPRQGCGAAPRPRAVRGQRPSRQLEVGAVRRGRLRP